MDSFRHMTLLRWLARHIAAEMDRMRLGLDVGE
jgi:hypothetical protein